MIRAFESIASYDFGTWMLGIMRSFISGGSAAVAGGLSVMGIDSEHFNLHKGLPHVLEMMFTMFLIMGLYRMFEFLQLHGAPDKLEQALANASAQSNKAMIQATKAAGAVADARDAASSENKQ